jgi:plastocyanin
MKAIEHVNRIVLAGILTVLVMAGLSCSSPTSSLPTPPENTIGMANDKFSPVTMTINRGETITWVNSDEEVHTATSDISEGGWNTGDIAPGTSRSITFHSAGTYPYHCLYHFSMGMKGTIIVK